MSSIQKEETKEPFCTPCAIGLASLITGAGLTGGSKGIKNKKTKQIIFLIGLSVSIISIIVIVYFLFIRSCDTCK